MLPALALSGCSATADEQALRESLAAMQQAAEQRRSDDFLDHVANNFAGSHGLDRAGLRQLLALQFLRNQSIGATIGPVDVRIEGERAQVDFVVLVTGGEGGLIPARAEGYRIRSAWRFSDGEWRVELAEWQ